MATQIQLRHGTASEWVVANPVLAPGEMGVVIDTYTYKIGNGINDWLSLPAYQLSPELAHVMISGISSEPSATEAGKMVFYAKSIAGRMMPKIKGPAGLDTALQPALFSNGIIMLAPGATTALTTLGTPVTTQTGTASTPVIESGNGLRRGMRRFTVTSAATAGSVAMQRTSLFQCFRGDAPMLGGFFFNLRFAAPTTVAESHLQCGLFGATSLSAATLPSAQLNWLGVGWEPGDTNLHFFHNSAVGTATKIDLGPNFPARSIDAVYDLTMFSPPNGDTVSWRVSRLDVPDAIEGEALSNIPNGGERLAYHAKLSNGTAASSVVWEMMRMYIETDH